MLIEAHDIARNDKQRASLDRATAEWLAAGNAICEVPPGVSGEPIAPSTSRARGNAVGAVTQTRKAEERAAKVRILARQGLNARQIAEATDVTPDTVVRIAKRNRIRLPGRKG